MKHSILFLLALSSCLAGISRAGGAPRYVAFDVTSHEDPKVTLRFSDADATRSAPVVISIPGRKLTNADRVHRTSLQKHWLSLNVPKNLKLLERTLDQCGLKRPGEYPFCDRYVFVDPATKRKFDYYIYVGNWP